MFYYRHQAGGVLTAHPFEAMPTDEQLEPLRKSMLDRFGATHPRTKLPYWERIEETTGELEANGSPRIVAHGHTEAMSGNPAPISEEQAADARAERERLPVLGQGSGSIQNP